LIIIFAQWANLDNNDSENPDEWFNKIKAIGATSYIPPFSTEKFGSMAEISALWVLPDEREYPDPYVKRTYTTNWTKQLKEKGWAQKLAERYDLVANDVGPLTHLNLISQIAYIGGSISKLRQHDGRGTYGWRDTTICFTCDCFYRPDGENKLQATEWQAQNDAAFIGESGQFCDEDRRLLWGSFGDRSLHRAQRFYYEPGVYDQLVALKKKVDPRNVFTPNEFCVGVEPAALQEVKTTANLLNILYDSDMSTKTLHRHIHYDRQHARKNPAIAGKLSAELIALQLLERSKTLLNLY